MIEFVCGIAAGIVLTKKLNVLEKVKLPKLPKSIVIVQVGDKYAIRKGYFVEYKYKDLNDSNWWSEKYRDQYCLGSKKQIKELYCATTAPETVVDL